MEEPSPQDFQGALFLLRKQKIKFKHKRKKQRSYLDSPHSTCIPGVRLQIRQNSNVL
jgi:hypothetical protein